jgi:hypothetical protein
MFFFFFRFFFFAQADCGIDSGTRSLTFFGVDTEMPKYEPYILPGAFIGIFTGLGIVLSMCLNNQNSARHRDRNDDV